MATKEGSERFSKNFEEYQGIAKKASSVLGNYVDKLNDIPKHVSFFSKFSFDSQSGKTIKVKKDHVETLENLETLLTCAIAGSGTWSEAIQDIHEVNFPFGYVYQNKEVIKVNQDIYRHATKVLGIENPKELRRELEKYRMSLKRVIADKRFAEKDKELYGKLTQYLSNF